MLMVIMPAPRRTVCTTITQPKIDSKPDSPWNIRTRRKSPGTAIPNTRVTLSETFPCRYKYQKTLGAAASLPSISLDKKTLHGSYFRLYNDFLGTKKMQIWPSFGHGYYVANMEPAQLKETLEKRNNPERYSGRGKETCTNIDKFTG